MTDKPLNYCVTCERDFASLTAFDRHRVGTYEYDFSVERPDGRRCMDADEIAAAGLTLNERGRYHDAVSAARVRAAFEEAA